MTSNQPIDKKFKPIQSQIEELDLAAKVIKSQMEELPYHNFNHACEVAANISLLAIFNAVPDDYRLNLTKMAALWHDHTMTGLNPELNSALAADAYLAERWYDQEDRDFVKDKILITKRDQSPKDVYEQLMLDADTMSLGISIPGRGTTFWEASKQLQQEYGLNKHEWYERQIEFIKNHEFYTEWAKEHMEPTKGIHLHQIQAAYKMLRDEFN